MATKKISSNELKSLIKEIAKQELLKLNENSTSSIEDRFRKTALQIEESMGKILIKNFPEVQSGDIAPHMSHKLERDLIVYIKHWYEINTEEN